MRQVPWKLAGGIFPGRQRGVDPPPTHGGSDTQDMGSVVLPGRWGTALCPEGHNLKPALLTFSPRLPFSPYRAEEKGGVTDVPGPNALG